MKPRKETPEDIWLDALTVGSGRAIEMQEKHGQGDFVNSESLPVRINYGTWDQLKQMGVVEIEDHNDAALRGELFCEVRLPDGWKKVATDHSMWSHLVDDKGRKRGSIFYKAAFYDRDAHMSLSRRFSFKVEPIGGWDGDYKKRGWHCVVMDGDKQIWEAPTKVEAEPEGDLRNEKQRKAWLAWAELKDKLSAPCIAWLNEHYPNWEDVTGYWD